MEHHHHDHGHDFGRAFIFAITLNSVFVAIEIVGGLINHSMALTADGVHNLFDVFSLLLAWWSEVLTQRRPDERYTYGLRSSSILAALANAMLLLVACGAIGWEALHRLWAPPHVPGLVVSAVASIGIVINGLSAVLFMPGRKKDLNVRAAFMHMAADALVSLGVVIAGFCMYFWAQYWVDPLSSLLIMAVILWGTWQLLRDSIHLALQAVPPHIDIQQVRQYLCALPNVAGVHDLHIWGMSTRQSALTVHLIMPGGHPGDAFVADVAHDLEHRFNIHHCTIQIDLKSANDRCSLQPPSHENHP